MPFQIGNRFFSDEISNNRIYKIAHYDTQPEESLWEKIKAFFCSANKPEAWALIRQIYHPPDRTEWETVAGKFEQLKTLTYGGFKERVQVGRDGENRACILDENGDEMLSVTVDKETGNYTVRCQEGGETHHITNTAAPRTIQDYEAFWSAWEKNAPAGEAPDRAAAVQRMLKCLKTNNRFLNLYNLKLTSLPDYLPPNITIFSAPCGALTHLPAILPAGLKELYCNGNQLTVLPALPAGLQVLHCNGNQLTVLPALPAGLQELRCDSNQLTVLPALPAGLRKLNCSENPLTCLPSVLPTGLQELSCYHNQLTSLPPLPTGLQELNCNHNQLTCLLPLPTGLQELNCNHNQLTCLPPLPTRLRTLRCNNNQLTSLPPLPTGLQELRCNHNQLTSLPVLPERLEKLIVDNNQLTSLPVLPGELQYLFGANNRLTSLPVLPRLLLTLFVNNNQLTSLPELPPWLQNLFCGDNQLTSMPALSARLQRLYVVNNQLTTLPGIAGLVWVTHISVSGNPLSAHTRRCLEILARDRANPPASRKAPGG